MSSPATSRRRYLRKREELLAQAKLYRETHPEKRWEIHLRRMYGISPDLYYAFLKRQNNCCAICFSDTPGRRRKFAVDHNHKTGMIRGLLCTTCNNGLGYFKDSPKIMQRAVDYLEEKGHEGI